jgi:uncharacterized protein
MSAVQNKRQIQAIFSALAEGNPQPFWDSLADDVVWTIGGTTSWSGTFVGKAAVRNEIFKPLSVVLGGPPRNVVERFLADEDCVVVLTRGDNVTKAGDRYDNVYSLVFQLAEGRVKKVTEYLDTALLERALGPRPSAAT